MELLLLYNPKLNTIYYNNDKDLIYSTKLFMIENANTAKLRN